MWQRFNFDEVVTVFATVLVDYKDIIASAFRTLHGFDPKVYF
jgi:hypothetical protein